MPYIQLVDPFKQIHQHKQHNSSTICGSSLIWIALQNWMEFTGAWDSLCLMGLTSYAVANFWFNLRVEKFIRYVFVSPIVVALDCGIFCHTRILFAFQHTLPSSACWMKTPPFLHPWREINFVLFGLLRNIKKRRILSPSHEQFLSLLISSGSLCSFLALI